MVKKLTQWGKIRKATILGTTTKDRDGVVKSAAEMAEATMEAKREHVREELRLLERDMTLRAQQGYSSLIAFGEPHEENIAILRDLGYEVAITEVDPRLDPETKITW